MGELTITSQAVLAAEVVDRCYGIYRDGFASMQAEAAALHAFTAAEFSREMSDGRVDKYLADVDGDVVGLTTLTNDLTAVPWIEPQFYDRRWPDKVQRGEMFYLGFVVVEPGASRGRVATALIDTVLQRVAEAGGAFCWDAASCNVAGAIGRIHDRIENHWGAPVKTLDTQTYYGAFFGPPTEPVAAG